MKDHRLIDERSLAMHRLVAQKLRANPALVDLARTNLRKWDTNACPSVRPVLAEWRSIIEGPLDELLPVLTGEDQRATRLRQSSPFAGALTPSERFAILREFQNRESQAA